MFVDFLEWEEGGEREREKHWSVAYYMCPDQGLNPQPRYVPWGDGTRNLLVHGMMLQPNKPPSQGNSISFCLLKKINKDESRENGKKKI